MLIFSGAIALGDAHFGQGSGSILIEDVDCQGTESSLAECFYLKPSTCHHSEDVGVRCNTAAKTIPEVRLVGGLDGLEGNLQIKHSGVWGTVCDDTFTTMEAKGDKMGAKCSLQIYNQTKNIDISRYRILRSQVRGAMN
ncbi:hypothetical protein CHS0354_012521 [Potamilus streckersoni]|uniref:SRCR domain-containing protein n=1 Tax=Potamilus streckersoni TaxID=2493646 RepID=A0AAE0SW65_9BIVA|nr:hypothetical protein CHS0354_012521 [Potamilus streckersoni]